jgi:hypothetical protein
MVGDEFRHGEDLFFFMGSRKSLVTTYGLPVEISLGVKRPCLEDYHSHLSGTEVRYGDVIPPIIMYLHSIMLKYLSTGPHLLLTWLLKLTEPP